MHTGEARSVAFCKTNAGNDSLIRWLKIRDWDLEKLILILHRLNHVDITVAAHLKRSLCYGTNACINSFWLVTNPYEIINVLIKTHKNHCLTKKSNGELNSYLQLFFYTGQASNNSIFSADRLFVGLLMHTKSLTDVR